MILKLLLKKKKKKILSQIEGFFPSTSSLKINWITKLPSLNTTKKNKKKQEKPINIRPLSITAQQLTLHSIGGGIISTVTEYKFEILNGTTNTFSIGTDNFLDNFKILRVEGDSIKKWELKKKNNSNKWNF